MTSLPNNDIYTFYHKVHNIFINCYLCWYKNDKVLNEYFYSHIYDYEQNFAEYMTQ